MKGRLLPTHMLKSHRFPGDLTLTLRFGPLQFSIMAIDCEIIKPAPYEHNSFPPGSFRKAHVVVGKMCTVLWGFDFTAV